MDLKSKIGTKSRVLKNRLSALDMVDFALCVRSPMAKKPSKDSSIAPSMFTIFRNGEFEIMDAIGVQLKQVLHAEQEYEFFKPILPDQEVEYQAELTSVLEKKGKDYRMSFLVCETKLTIVEDHSIAGICKSTIVYREKTTDQASPPSEGAKS